MATTIAGTTIVAGIMVMVTTITVIIAMAIGIAEPKSARGERVPRSSPW
jgi:hypothetical protein